MKTQFLLLWLEAPLQSWGADSKFGRRDSLNFPTKSGVLGLLCCALGAGGEQLELLECMSNLHQTVVSFIRQTEKEERLVKLDREPLLRDFHMVGSGFNAEDPWLTLHIPKTNEGKKAVGGGTKMTYRYYLQDARFAVAVEVPEERADEFINALQNPCYDLYLGRKNCVPTDFIYQGRFQSENEALDQAHSFADDKGFVEDFRVVDGECSGEIMTINDVPMQFGEIKRYQDRIVTVQKCDG